MIQTCIRISGSRASKLDEELRGPARGEYVAGLCGAEPPPGVLAYDGDVPVGWAAVAPRADTTYARSRTIRHLARAHRGRRGVRKNFERAGFVHADTRSVLAGHPRVVMRLDLG
ncbi:hypothetical protein ABZ848_46845 [Streptomyces sp. NPDC047081]|uniref:hypothetical protein n=1 Tax=Streptomyces sp. NPDC047081 TaxID=3154706 RepID=UPI0033F6A205